MSEKDLNAFADKVAASDELQDRANALREQYGKSLAEAQSQWAHGLAELAQQQGFEITPEEAGNHIAESVQALVDAGAELSDEQLEAVAGGTRQTKLSISPLLGRGAALLRPGGSFQVHPPIAQPPDLADRIGRVACIGWSCAP